MLQRIKIARINFKRLLDVLQAFFAFTLAAENVAGQLEDSGIVWQRASGNLQFCQGAVIIEIAAINMFCPGQMYFSGVGTELKGLLQRSLSLRQACRCVIDSGSEVKLIVGADELAVRKEKRGIADQGEVQQIHCLLDIRSSNRAEGCIVDEIFSAAIQIKCGDIGRGTYFDRSLFVRRKLGLKLIGNGGGDFTLDREHVGQIAIISLRPKMRVCPRVDQLSIHPHAIGRALHAAF